MTDELPVLDQAVLGELRDSVGGDEAFVRELASTFVAESGSHLEALAAAAAAGDAAAIVRPAHSLKSSGAALGAMRLSAMCRDIEHAGRDGRAADNAQLAAVQATWDATLGALKEAGLTE